MSIAKKTLLKYNGVGNGFEEFDKVLVYASVTDVRSDDFIIERNFEATLGFIVY